MNRSWDPPKKAALQLTESTDNLRSPPSEYHDREKDALMEDDTPLQSPIERNDDFEMQAPQSSQPRRSVASYFCQYGIPLLLPVLIASVAGLWMAGLHIKISASLGEAPEADELPELSALAVNVPSQDGEADIQLETGLWGSQLHALTHVTCPTGAVNTTFYPGPVPATALATYPRSGNSYIRGLIERATTYRTSSVYCDGVLAKTFLG